MKKPLLVLLALSSTMAHAYEPIDLKENRLGSIVINKETSEEIYISCVDQNADNQCIAYRFVSQIADDPRILGNYNVELYEMLKERHFNEKYFFKYKDGEQKQAIPTLKWFADDSGFFDDEGRLRQKFEPLMWVPPFTVLPVTIGTVGAVYDSLRLVVLLPIETVKTISKKMVDQKLEKTFALMFNDSMKSKTKKLKTKRFDEFKNMVLKLATQTEATPRG